MRESVIPRLDSATGQVIFDSAPVGMLLVSKTGHILRANPAFCRFLGYGERELTARTVLDITHPDDKASTVRRMRSMMSKGWSTGHSEKRYIHKSGKVVWGRVEGGFVKDRGKRTDVLIALVVDITRRMATEVALAEKHRLASAMAETIPAIVYVYDLEKSRNAYSNNGLHRVLGYSSKDVKAMGKGLFAKLVHPDDLPGLIAFQTKIRSAADGEIIEGEHRAKHRDGTWRVLHTYESPFSRNDDGSVGLKIGVAVDITERKHADEALRIAKERSESILSSITDLHIAYDRGLRFTDLNARAEHDSGLRRRDLIGRPLLAVLPHAKSTELYRQYRSALATNKPVHADFVHSPLTGKWYETHVYPSKDGLAVYYKDVTKRKNAEDALRAAKERTEEILNGMTDIYIAYDRKSRFTDLNARAEETIGKTKAEVVGKPFWKVFPHMRNGEFHRLYKKVLATNVPAHFDSVSIAGKWYETHVYPSQSGVSVYFKDVSARKQAEEALQKANDELEQKVKDRTIMLRALAVQLDQAEHQERRRVAQVLHDDLQQILVGARFKLDGLKKTVSDVAQRKTVERVEENLAYACATMRSLCAELHPPVLFEEGIAAAMKWLADDAKEKFGLAVKLAMDKIDESSLVMLRIFVFNAVREMLFNVVKHAGVKSAEVRVSDVDGDSLQIEVRDRGVGFDPRQVRAGGFGLFSIRERAEHLGGSMKIQSKPGKGACITLTLSRI